MKVGDLVIHKPTGGIGIITHIFPSYRGAPPSAEVDFVYGGLVPSMEAGLEIIQMRYIEVYHGD